MRRSLEAETLEDIRGKIARIGVATVGHQAPGLVTAYDAGSGDAEDTLRHQAAARAFNPDIDPWLEERTHAAGIRPKAGARGGHVDAEGDETTARAPVLRRREWSIGGWKAHDIAVAAAVGVSCALAVGAVLTPIVAPHVFDGTIQGGGSSGAASMRERRLRAQRTMAAELRSSRAGHVVVTGGDGVSHGGEGEYRLDAGLPKDEKDKNWFDRGVEALGRSQQKPVLPIPAVPGYSRDSVQQDFNFRIR